MTDTGYTDRHHAELLERLERIAVGLEALNLTADRQSRLLAEVSARVDAALRYFIQAWKQLRGARS
jgi:hypothetical protein